MTYMNMPDPTISVIIPTYQHAKELPDCLASIFRQSFSDFEVIVVNDGSTDNTPEVLGPYMDRIRLVNQENRGANAARNRGFEESGGEYLLFCDADIVMKEDMLEVMLKTLENHKDASYVYSSFKYGFKTFRLWPFDAEKLRKMNYIHTTSLMRREAFPGFDESIRRLQDWDLWLTMLERGRTGVWIPEVKFRAIPHEGGISTWVPGIMYRIPWRIFGIRIRSVEKYLEAERVIKEKHNLP